MDQFFIYLLQVNLALALFYLLYAILLRKDTFLQLRRFFFLSVIVFSLLYPLWSVPALGDFWLAHTAFGETEGMVLVGEPGMEIAEDDGSTAPTVIPWGRIIAWIYVIVSMLFLLRFIIQLLLIFRIKKRSEKCLVRGIPVYQLKENITPFSFFKGIFIHTVKHSEAELSQILLHEQTHARQWHSVDIMLIESVCLFSWWNPFVWLMKREMAMNLEYLADNRVLMEGIDSQQYQYYLLRLTYHETAVQIVNNFNVSQLKQRIMMMNKAKTPTLKLAKYFLILPLAFLLITANSCVNRDKKSGSGDVVEDGGTAQIPTDTSRIAVSDILDNPNNKEEDVFVVVEEQPQYPGGNAALMKFLGDNVKYPTEAQEKGIQGRVICNFVIDKDGSLSDFNVVRGIDPLLDNEALRVLKLMPNWIPGKQRGENVRVRFTLPVVFRLSMEGDTKEITPKDASNSPIPYPVKVSTSNEIFVVVEEQPEFPGGNAAMMKWMSDNVEYPKVAQENGVQGRVIVNFIVEKDGNLGDVQVVRGVDPSLDKEAVRLIEAMPKWNPGSQRGERVRVRYTLPVVFRLQN